jgi:uncharacterized membrane protein YhaH (DUF805 family)
VCDPAEANAPIKKTEERIMNFTESISTVFKKYATFTGTASRSEFWWFCLFCVVVSMLLTVSDTLRAIFGLATLVHDTDRSGWWQLLGLIPVIGWIVLLVFYVQESRPNRYAEPAVDLAKANPL